MHARQALVPGSRQITREQKIRFLDRIAAGERHDVAARQVGSTGTRFRWLERNDPEFNRAYLQATEEAPRGLQDRIRKEIGERMFDRSDPSSARLLVLEAEAHLPEYEHRRTRHLKHSGGLTVQAIPFIDQAKLEALPDDRFELFMGVLREIVSDREPIQLPAGNQLPVIEAA